LGFNGGKFKRVTLARVETTESQMVSETVTQGLEKYRIGEKVRALRKGKKLLLAQLGTHTGLSPALLSRIERGQLVPTLPTLLRIALVFGVGLEHFFVEAGKRPLVAVVRRQDRLRLPDNPDSAAPRFHFESLDFPVTDRLMEAYLAEFTGPAEATEPHAHDGAEFVYMLSGRLAIEVGREQVFLDAGDAAYFDSSVPHSYRDDGAGRCAAIFVVTGGRRESA
jgi:transcriptional regulator with XRE-family HTH domain